MDTSSISKTFSAFKMPEQYTKPTQQNVSPATNVVSKNDAFVSTQPEKKSKKGKIALAAAVVAAGATLIWALKTGKIISYFC